VFVASYLCFTENATRARGTSSPSGPKVLRYQVIDRNSPGNDTRVSEHFFSLPTIRRAGGWDLIGVIQPPISTEHNEVAICHRVPNQGVT
jgi:hypothetical protein